MVFIDNSNIYRRLVDMCKIDPQSWCKQYDPKYLAEKLVGGRTLEKVYFYCAPPPQRLFKDSPQKYAAQNSYYAKVQALPGIELKYATLTQNGGGLFEKNLDTQLTADVIIMAAANAYDQAIIVSSDGDFVSAVLGAKSQGKKIEVAHFKKTASMDLRQSVDITRRLRASYFRSI